MSDIERISKIYGVDFDTIDLNGKLSINAISKYVQELAAKHATKLGINFFEHGTEPKFYWILSRVKYEVYEYPSLGEDITIETFPTGCEKLFFVRKFELRNSKGDIVGNVTGYYLIMDVNKKRPVKIKLSDSKLEKLNRPYEGEKVNKIEKAGDVLISQTRTAYYSEIDFNGHMNNSHYIRWCLDAIYEYVPKETSVSCIEMNYNSSVMLGDIVDVVLYKGNNGEYIISGDKACDGKNYFMAKILVRAS